MLPFRSFIMLMESFKDAERKWTMAGNNPETVKKAIALFKSFRDRKLTNHDIGRFMKRPFSDFQDFVQDLMDMDSERKKAKVVERDAKKMFENDNLLIVVPRTHAASQKYGAHTQWCITEHSDYYWNHYTAERGLTPHFIIFKESCNDYDWLSDNNLEKIAIMVGTDHDIESVFKANDEDITTSLRSFTLNVPDESESMDFDEFMAYYGCEINDHISSYLTEEYDEKEVTRDTIVDYINSDKFDDMFNELQEVYAEDTTIDQSDRVTPDDLEAFFEHMLVLDWLKNTNPNEFCFGEFNRLFSDFMKRTFKYPEATALNAICDDFRDYIDDMRSNEVGDTSQYVWYEAA